MPKVEMNMPEPPSGYEYTGEVEYAQNGAIGGSRNFMRYDLLLRRVRPSTVTVELPRNVADWIIYAFEEGNDEFGLLHQACRAALEKEEKG